MRQVIDYSGIEIVIDSNEMPEMIIGDYLPRMTLTVEIGTSMNRRIYIELESHSVDEAKALSIALRRAVVSMTTPQKSTNVAFG